MKELLKVVNEDWKYLIVLDACRYDYFERIYPEFFKGSLRRVRSVGTYTAEWLRNSFPDYYEDVVYIAANPHVNSKKSVKRFTASNHFAEIYDLWDYGWSPKYRTVHPKDANNEMLKVSRENPEKRIIIHYNQPHEPYLNIEVSRRYASPRERRLARSFWRIIRFALNKRLFGLMPYWKLREFLGASPACAMDEVRRVYGEKAIREAYEDNLRIVLAYVNKLLGELKGRVVITSDHGELLGEDGLYLHPQIKHPILSNVPWFVVENAKEIGNIETEETLVGKEEDPDRDKIEDRLRDLGYLE